MMETRPASHPAADVLLALGAGKLDDATAEAVFSHVEVCPKCLEAVGRLSGTGFLAKLRAGHGDNGDPAPSEELSTVPPASNIASILTTDARPALTILPELRDHPQYEVLRELGRGGMGVVYLAKNKLMDRLEVLKVVNKQLLGEAGAAERFLREIRSAAQLIHPNIVTAFSALQAGDLLLFSMEYIEGRDLAEVVKARGPLPTAHSGSYILQAARGLQHAFEKGMIHRDIKPQNLILDGKKNIVKILDFGLAKMTHATAEVGEGLTALNMMMGTPDYMAPEQALDAANVDIRADIYSLGCTLYCLLAGRAPFVGGSLASKIAAHQVSEPEPVENLRSDLPPGLPEIVRKMMAKDPTQRYQQPAEVVQALTICFKGKGNQPAAKGSPANVDTAKPAAALKPSLKKREEKSKDEKKPSSNGEGDSWESCIKREGKSIFEKKTIAPITAPRQTMKEHPSPVVRLKNEERTRGRKRRLMAAGGAVTLVGGALVAALMLWAMSGKTPAPETRIVQKNLIQPITQEPKTLAPTETPPPSNTDPVDAPAVVTPPFVVKAPDEPADKPGARVVRTYDWRYAGGVRSIGFSQDGNTALALGADGVLTQFNPRTGESISLASALGYPLKCAALTPDGRRAVIAGGDNRVHVRDLEVGKDISSLSGAVGPVNWVDVASDGKTAILGGDDGTITLWDLQRGAAKKSWKGSDKSISVVRFSPSGKSALSCGQDEIAHFWNVADGSETGNIDNYLPGRSAKPVTAVFITDDKSLVGFTNGARAVWDLKTNHLLNGGHEGGADVFRAVAASPDGRLTATASDARPGFTLIDQKKPGLYNAPTPPVAPECLTLSPDSRHLLVGCADGSLHYVAVTLPGEETVPAIVKAPAGKKEAALLAAGSTFSGKAAAKAYLAEAAPLLQEAKADDDYERVAPLLPGVRKAAAEAHDAEMFRTAASLEKLQKDYEAVKKDVQTLKAKPDDAEANLAVGKFYCFQKQDYDKGDPYLVKSGNLALATAATADAEGPTEVAKQVALADAWMKLASNPAVGSRLGAKRRAYDWYIKALPNLTSNEEERVKVQVMDLTKQFPDVLSAWEDLDVSKVEAVGNAYLRLKPAQSISIKAAVEGPVEIVLVARTAKTPPTFEFMASKQPFLAWKVRLDGVTGSRVPKGRFGTGTFGGTNFQFTPNVWVTYTCKLQDAKMEGLVDGKLHFIDSNKNDLSKSRTIQLMAVDQTLEVQSFNVNPLDKP